MKGDVPTILIPNVCTALGCKRRPMTARKLSDFWVATCEAHTHARIHLDLNKTFSARPGPVLSSAAKDAPGAA